MSGHKLVLRIVLIRTYLNSLLISLHYLFNFSRISLAKSDYGILGKFESLGIRVINESFVLIMIIALKSFLVSKFCDQFGFNDLLLCSNRIEIQIFIFVVSISILSLIRVSRAFSKFHSFGLGYYLSKWWLIYRSRSRFSKKIVFTNFLIKLNFEPLVSSRSSESIFRVSGLLRINHFSETAF